MKKILSLFLTTLILLSLCSVSALADNKITVMINGEELVSDVPAQAIPVYDENGSYVGDRTMLPLRAVCEKLNCDVYWDADTSGIVIYRKNNLYIMWVDAPTAFNLDGVSLSGGYSMDVPPTIVDSRTLVPVRAVAELLGAEVNWIDQTKTVDIKYDLGDIEENAGVAEQCVAYEQLLLMYYGVYDNHLKGTLENVTGKFVLESGEEIKFELYPYTAPATCENFIKLANENFYDNTIFHRVINGFVAQGGGYDAGGEYKESEPVGGEFLYNGFFNLIPHTRGALSLARAQDYNSGSSQFFIVHQDSPYLDGQYAVFGRITEGMDIVDKICEAETDENDRPLTSIIVKDVIINQ